MSEEKRKVKSVRLNQYLREIILNSVLEEYVKNNLKPYGFETRDQLDKAVKKHRHGACMKLWKKQYGSIDFSLVPRWALDTSGDFSVAQQDDTSKVFVIRLKDDNNLALPCKSAIDVLVTKSKWDAMFSKSNALAKAKEACTKGRGKLKDEVKPILDSFSSTKQLLDTWPSMEKFLPPNVADPDKGVNLPALSLSRLEEKINGK